MATCAVSKKTLGLGPESDPSTILRISQELNACRFKRCLDCNKSPNIPAWNANHNLQTLDSCCSNPGKLRQIRGGPSEQGSCSSNLIACNQCK